MSDRSLENQAWRKTISAASSAQVCRNAIDAGLSDEELCKDDLLRVHDALQELIAELRKLPDNDRRWISLKQIQQFAECTRILHQGDWSSLPNVRTGIHHVGKVCEWVERTCDYASFMHNFNLGSGLSHLKDDLKTLKATILEFPEAS